MIPGQLVNTPVVEKVGNGAAVGNDTSADLDAVDTREKIDNISLAADEYCDIGSEKFK